VKYGERDSRGFRESFRGSACGGDVELNAFITKTLVEIAVGINNANKEASQKLPHIAAQGKDKEYIFMLPLIGTSAAGDSGGKVDFDIAVSVSQSDEASGGGGLKVYVVDLGGKAASKSVQENTHRVKFEVATGKHIY
jgi:hypothetical protein